MCVCCVCMCSIGVDSPKEMSTYISLWYAVLLLVTFTLRPICRFVPAASVVWHSQMLFLLLSFRPSYNVLRVFLPLSLSVTVFVCWPHFLVCLVHTAHTHTSRGKSTTLSHCHSLFIIVNRKSSLWKYNYVWCIIMCCDDGVASSSCFVAAKSRHACGGA